MEFSKNTGTLYLLGALLRAIDTLAKAYFLFPYWIGCRLELLHAGKARYPGRKLAAVIRSV